MTPQMHERYSVILQSIPSRFGAVCVYAAYLYAIQKLDDDVITGLNLIMALGTTLFRVYLQRLFSVCHKDVNCYAAFLFLYCGQSMFFTFATPGYKDTVSTYITAAVNPLTFFMWGVLHQSQTWFRVRNWLKVCVCVMCV